MLYALYLLLAFLHLHTARPRQPQTQKDFSQQSTPTESQKCVARSQDRTNWLQVAGSSQPTNNQTLGERSIEIEHVSMRHRPIEHFAHPLKHTL
jgi:hypothetical protein